MNSISIKTALTALFALMILMIAGIGYVAVTRIAGINENVERMGNRHLPKLAAIGTLTNTVNDFRNAEAEYAISTTEAEMAAAEKQFAAHEADFAAKTADLQKFFVTREERSSYEAFRPKWTRYMDLHRRLVQSVHAKQSAEINKLFAGEMGAALDEMRSDLRAWRAAVLKGAEVQKNDAAADYSATLWLTFIVIGAGIALAIVAMAYSFFGVSRPIEEITASMSGLAKGDTTRPIPFGDRRNEIGSMASAVQVFKDNMIRARELESEAEASKATAEAARKRAMNEMADNFERAVGGIVASVSDAAGRLQTAAQSLSNASSDTTHQSTVVAAASEEAAANVRMVAAAAEELSGSIREITRQVSESANMASRAVQEAEATNAQVSGLSVGAQKIGAIVDLINDIASKTNLLALNATIEAARAGEAGRGFAVVASEVKALAEQTSKATAEITGHIGGVQSSTDQAANAILGIGRTIDNINQIAAGIAAAVEEQGAATEEIARNVDQAAQGTVEVTRNIAGVNRAAETSSVSAKDVLTSATDLSTQSERLRTEMQKFLSTVRAA
jgi:methyl-accepting chemotaxis protein